MYKPLQEEGKNILEIEDFKGDSQHMIDVQRVGDEILIEGTEPNYEGIIYKPTITSLENIPKYTNLFVCVHPFILHGYRIHHNLKDCAWSLFTLHNESLNIWTHFVPFFAFLILIIYNLSDPSVFLRQGNIIFLYLITSTLLFLFSSMHHTFSCHSNEVWNCCYKLDLTGIMFQLISATICSIHFMFHDYDTLRRNYMIIFCTLGVLTICFSLFDFFISAKLNIFVMFLYAFLFLLSFACSVHWVLIANINEVEEVAKYILVGFTFMFVGFVFFLAKFPECVFPSKTVDLFFQSHIIWHLCCLGCVISYYLMLYYYNNLINIRGINYKK